MKRKRKTSQQASLPAKRPRIDAPKPAWALLRQYYPVVSTLRQYIVAKLSSVSENRKERLERYGLSDDGEIDPNADPSIITLLDRIAVGSFKRPEVSNLEPSEVELSVFTQQLSSSTTPITVTQGAFKQSEIVDFTIWLLFRRHTSHNRPAHLLAHGYQRSASGPENGLEIKAVAGVPGIFCNGLNRHATAIKGHPWTLLPSLVGSGAERILSDLFLQCGIFRPVENSNNLEQICGIPMSELKVLATVGLNGEGQHTARGKSHGAASQRSKQNVRGLGDIRFLRHRMLYARPTLSKKSKVCLGVSYAHALNRYRDPKDHLQTLQLLRYVFPRQFGLHNVFTSNTRPKDTAQPFKDYTIREQEIARAKLRWRRTQANQKDATREPPVPKRLRGAAQDLVKGLHKRHVQCPYRTLLDHYCPLASPLNSASTDTIGQASNLAQVSAFCKAAVSRVFPDTFWGIGPARSHNKSVILQNVDRFIRLRRYETMSLHDVLQQIEITGVQWLCPPHTSPNEKMSATDFTKRKELMAEVLYYLFDSYLIPLIRGHFHVTESGAHRNQLFYFRHDVWHAISAPALRALKTKMLEQCNTAEIKKDLTTRALGVSQVRLLPKEKGMRPIINLRRRVQKLQRGEMVLGRSINNILTPTFSILNYKRTSKPDLLASALFSVDEMYSRLQDFRRRLEDQGWDKEPLFFAKVDVKACFDTIPQKKLMELAREIIAEEFYQITKHSRAKLIGGHENDSSGFGAKPAWRYLTKATLPGVGSDFDTAIKADTKDGRTRTVYVDGGFQKLEYRKQILDLLEQHVEANLIQVGSRFYRQKKGIPQGSIVSSLLCSFFYSEMVRKELDFIANDQQSMLLRLIDDFLVISTRRNIAERFMQTMHAGLPIYGIEIKPEKSRTNFDLSINGVATPRLPEVTDFPYCGNAINTVTLDLSRDQERRKKSNLADAMSVEYSQLPGQSFYRKMMTALKLQMRAMLLSTSYNMLTTVLANLYRSFTELAVKMFYYMRALPERKKPKGVLVIKTVDDLISLACVLMRRRKRSSKESLPYECSVSAAQARWLAYEAFQAVFQRRQAAHGELLAWLRGRMMITGVGANGDGELAEGRMRGFGNGGRRKKVSGEVEMNGRQRSEVEEVLVNERDVLLV